MRPALLSRMDQTGVPLLIARIVVGLLMLRMGWSKAWDPVGFLKLLREYEMLPDGAYVVQNFIAVTLPWIEVVCALLLIAGVLIRGSSLTLLILLTVFNVVIIMRTLDIHATEGIPYCDIHFDCGCGGGDVYMCAKLPENIGLWMLSWIGLLSRSRRFCLAGLLFPSRFQAPTKTGAEVV